MPKVLKKFYRRGPFLRHKRVDSELKKYKNFCKSQSENAKKRWEKEKKQENGNECHRIKSAYAKRDAKTCQSESYSESESYPPLTPQNTGGGEKKKKKLSNAEQDEELKKIPEFMSFVKWLSQFEEVGKPFALGRIGREVVFGTREFHHD